MSTADKAAGAARRGAQQSPDKHQESRAMRKGAAPDEPPAAARPIDELLRGACRSGRANLAARTPPLTECPDALFALQHDEPPAWHTPEDGAWSARAALGVLQLGTNALSEVDERVGAFAALTRLELHANQLTHLPASLGALTRLTTLTLAHNRLTELPAAVLRLDTLTSLDVSHNALESLWTPQQVADAGGAVLRGLRHLDVSHNRLRNGAFLRADGGEVDVLALPRALRRLDLSDNALQGPLPLQLVAPLDALEELALIGNELGDAVFAPPRPSAGAPPALPRLAVLDVRRTGVAALAALEALFASGAALTLDEARDAKRAAAAAPAPTAGVAARQLVRVSARPSAADAELPPIAVAVEGRATSRAPLFVVLDAGLVRHEPSRRKRGGRGRGGDKRDDHDEHAHAAPHDAGSALANAKLSSKKKEALGQVPCKFFRNNGCSAGDACPFAHTLPGEGQPKAVCQWYLKGSCRFGHRCALAHILPGQPMSMDRKNKRAAQQGQKADERAAAAAAHGAPADKGGEKRGAGAPTPGAAPAGPSRMRATPLAAPGTGAVFIPDAPRAARDESSPPPARSVSQERAAWDGASGSLDASGAAFGTSPFSYPGSHSVFFNTNRDADVGAYAFGTTPSHAPWTRAATADVLAESSHAEDFLPSSLSDLLTPAELERRTRSAREPLGAARHVSQSLPSAPDFGLRELSPPGPPMGAYGRTGRVGAQGTPMPGRLGGAHSVHASPFLAALGSPPSVSPPGAVGERVASSFGARPDERRRSMAHALAAPPISPALLPARDDADDTIFELES